MKPYQTRILEAAIRSPSGDNCQPWRFLLPSDDRIVITTSMDDAKSFFDFNLHGTLMSLGAVIENIRVQAAAEGFRTVVDYNESVQGGEHSVIIRLESSDVVSAEKDRVEALRRRTVNRRPYLPSRTSQGVLNRLLIEPVDGTLVSVVNSFRGIFRWSRVVYVADRIRYSHPVIHKELFACLLMNKQTIQSRRAGLEIDRLGAGPLAKPLMNLIKPWERMAKLLRFGMDRLLASQSRLMCLLSGSLVMVSIEEDTRKSWILAGEQMQRLWNRAQELGLCVHPVTVALYLDHRYQSEGMKDYLPRHEPLLTEINHALEPLLQGRIGTIIFRLGKGWPMRDTAVRLPLEHFVRGET